MSNKFYIFILFASLFFTKEAFSSDQQNATLVSLKERLDALIEEGLDDLISAADWYKKSALIDLDRLSKEEQNDLSRDFQKTLSKVFTVSKKALVVFNRYKANPSEENGYEVLKFCDLFVNTCKKTIDQKKMYELARNIKSSGELYYNDGQTNYPQ